MVKSCESEATTFAFAFKKKKSTVFRLKGSGAFFAQCGVSVAQVWRKEPRLFRPLRAFQAFHPRALHCAITHSLDSFVDFPSFKTRPF